jgi:PadR family transcriptional regulator PadR
VLADPKLSHSAALILQAIHCGYVYGYNLMETTGLPSGTVYPALRRLQQDGLIRSQQERKSIAAAEQRPLRKYYKLTPAGKTTLQASHKRYPLLARLIPSMEVENA